MHADFKMDNSTVIFPLQIKYIFTLFIDSTIIRLHESLNMLNNVNFMFV